MTVTLLVIIILRIACAWHGFILTLFKKSNWAFCAEVDDLQCPLKFHDGHHTSLHSYVLAEFLTQEHKISGTIWQILNGDQCLITVGHYVEINC